MEKNIERFEEILMKIARIFGAGLMALTLFSIGALLVVTLVSGGAALIKGLFSKSYPKVEFYRSDFVSKEQMPGLSSGEVRPDSHEKVLAREIVSKLLPMYESYLDAYYAKQLEAIKDEDQKKTVREDAQKSRAENIRNFQSDSDYSNIGLLTQRIRQLDKKYQSDYAGKLIDYLDDANKAAIEGAPVFPALAGSLAYSVPRVRFDQNYDTQLAQLTESSKDASSGLMEKGIFYGSLFAMVMLFLLQALAFTMFRIEKKIGERK